MKRAALETEAVWEWRAEWGRQSAGQFNYEHSVGLARGATTVTELLQPVLPATPHKNKENEGPCRLQISTPWQIRRQHIGTYLSEYKTDQAALVVTLVQATARATLAPDKAYFLAVNI